MGWSCPGCKADLRSELKSLREKVNLIRQLPPEDKPSRKSSENLNDDVLGSIKQSQNKPLAERTVRYSGGAKVVNKSVNDSERRRRNVVITGLPETSSNDRCLRRI